MIKTIAVRVGAIALFLLANVLNAGAAETGGIETDAPKPPAVNRQVSDAYRALLSEVTGEPKRSVVLGQERWKKLRNNACVAQGHVAQDIDTCYENVDNERLRELRELTDITNRKREANLPNVDLDALLDKPMHLAAYAPEDTSDMRFDGSMAITHLPTTCRELYTLTAGAWAYTGDTIGMNSQENAFEACQTMLFEAQAQQPGRNAQADFNDAKLYANGITCFASRCDQGDSVSDTPEKSFEALRQQGQLTIESADLPMWGLDACKGVLVVQAPFFCIDGMNVRLDVSRPADYTGSGDTEAVVKLLFFPTEGTLRVHYLVLASYDPNARSIRVTPIDPNARIKLILAKQ